MWTLGEATPIGRSSHQKPVVRSRKRQTSPPPLPSQPMPAHRRRPQPRQRDWLRYRPCAPPLPTHHRRPGRWMAGRAAQACSPRCADHHVPAPAPTVTAPSSADPCASASAPAPGPAATSAGDPDLGDIGWCGALRHSVFAVVITPTYVGVAGDLCWWHRHRYGRQRHNTYVGHPDGVSFAGNISHKVFHPGG